MTEQNYANHRRFSIGFHYVLSATLFIGLIAAIVNIFRHSPHAGGFVSAVLIALLFICVMFTAFLARTFALKAQDRAVRAEESLRHFILSGKPVDNRLTIGQIAALRFASDSELLSLSEKAAAENLSPDAIKKVITNWRSDTHRV